jgi:hypothetical protein
MNFSSPTPAPLAQQWRAYFNKVPFQARGLDGPVFPSNHFRAHFSFLLTFLEIADKFRISKPRLKDGE